MTPTSSRNREKLQKRCAFIALACGLIQARHAFKALASADWYSEIIPKSLATGGLWIFVTGIFLIVQPTLLGLFATMGAPAGEKIITLVSNSSSMICIIAGVVTLAFGTAFQDARNLADENAGFI